MQLPDLATTYRAGVVNHWNDWNPKNIPLGGWIVIAVVIGIPVAAVIFIVAMDRFSGTSKLRGPTVTGTAQVLSVKDTHWGVSDNSHRADHIFRIRLRVEIPGREPYDVKIGETVPPWSNPPAPGETLAVKVATANPRKVRIDWNQPVSPHARPTTAVQDDLPLEEDLSVEQKLAIIARARDSGRITDAEFEGIERAYAINDAYARRETSGSVPQAAELLASGQRVPGVLMSFAADGHHTDSTYSGPELRSSPLYVLTVELHIPNLAPMTARNIQPIPAAVVPKLALGLRLTCAVDPANPAELFAVDWGD